MQKKYIAHNSLLPFYLAWKLEPSSRNYNLNFSYHLPTRTEVDILIDKLQELVNLKASLRQTFFLEGQKLIAKIHKKLSPKINFYCTTHNSFLKLEEKLILEVHDLHKGPLIKLNVIHFTDTNDYLLLFNIHHILICSPSLNQFIEDINRLISGKYVEPESVEDYLSKLKCQKTLLKYSDDSLEKYIQKVNKIGDEASYPAVFLKNNVLHYMEVCPNRLIKKLILYSERYDISLFNVLLLAYSIFVAKLFNKRNILVSYPVSLQKTRDLYGCFINVVLFPIQISEKDTFYSALRTLKRTLPTLKRASQLLLNEKFPHRTMPEFSYLTLDQIPALKIGTIQSEVKGYSQIAHSNLSFKFQKQGNKFHFVCDVLQEAFPK